MTLMVRTRHSAQFEVRRRWPVDRPRQAGLRWGDRGHVPSGPQQTGSQADPSAGALRGPFVNRRPQGVALELDAVHRGCVQAGVGLPFGPGACAVQTAFISSGAAASRMRTNALSENRGWR